MIPSWVGCIFPPLICVWVWNSKVHFTSLSSAHHRHHHRRHRFIQIYIQRVTVTIYTFIRRMCTHHSFVLKSNIFCIYVHFSPTHSLTARIYTFISFIFHSFIHSLPFPNNILGAWHNKYIYKFLCFTFRFCHCMECGFVVVLQLHMESRAWCSWVVGDFFLFSLLQWHCDVFN